MTYANINEVKAGMTVVLDDGFDCMKEGPVVVQADADGELFVPCSHGRHYLDGQCDDEKGVMVGVSLGKAA